MNFLKSQNWYTYKLAIMLVVSFETLFPVKYEVQVGREDATA